MKNEYSLQIIAIIGKLVIYGVTLYWIFTSKMTMFEQCVLVLLVMVVYFLTSVEDTLRKLLFEVRHPSSKYQLESLLNKIDLSNMILGHLNTWLLERKNENQTRS